MTGAVDNRGDAVSGVRLLVESPERMGELGRRLAGLLRPGDLVVLNGPLGAGKTTLTRGLGEGLAVTGEVSSPTFVIARKHRSAGAGPAMLHVDAYRLADADEVADLELDADLVDSVAVVEWGAGKVDDWAADRLTISIGLTGEDPDDPREVRLEPTGARWDDVNWTAWVEDMA